MSSDLVLKSSCGACGSTSNLYGSNCKHMTLCLSCGKNMAENRSGCRDCGATITRLIREYNVWANPSDDKDFFVGRFWTEEPNFSKKSSAENGWSAHRERPQGLHVRGAEKFPWFLEDGGGKCRYRGDLQGSQTSTYFVLILRGKELVAVPVGSWYKFNKVVQYKQLTLEEAEEKMINRRKMANSYYRWMMKAAKSGDAAFAGVEKWDEKVGRGGGKGRKKAGGDDVDDDDEGMEGRAEDEEDTRENNGLGFMAKGSDDDDDSSSESDDLDMDNDDIEKGGDWEHEAAFTDDDEAIDSPEEFESEDEGDEADVVKGELNESGRELKELLDRAETLIEEWTRAPGAMKPVAPGSVDEASAAPLTPNSNKKRKLSHDDANPRPKMKSQKSQQKNI